jgi:membrane protease YdiL (CAAX protease family)
VTQRQVVAVLTPPVLIATTYCIFRWLAGQFPGRWRIAWYLGLVAYWVLWGAGFSTWLLGPSGVRDLLRRPAFSVQAVLGVLLMLVLASFYRLVPDMTYEKPSTATLLLLLSSTLFNGFFEELLWRGVYWTLFPHSALWGIVWPTLWFALWHYVPGSMNPAARPLGLMVGSGLMGFYLSYLARRTGSIVWTMIAHTLGGVIMVR